MLWTLVCIIMKSRNLGEPTFRACATQLIEPALSRSQSGLDSPLCSLVKPSLSSSLLSASITLSLHAQNLSFQQIVPTSVDFWYPLDCLHGSWDWTRLAMLIDLVLVRFSFKFSAWFRVVGCLSVFDSTLNTQYDVVSYHRCAANWLILGCVQ